MGPANSTEVREPFSFSVWARIISRAIAQKVLFWIFIQHYNVPYLNHKNPMSIGPFASYKSLVLSSTTYGVCIIQSINIHKQPFDKLFQKGTETDMKTIFAIY